MTSVDLGVMATGFVFVMLIWFLGEFATAIFKVFTND